MTTTPATCAALVNNSRCDKAAQCAHAVSWLDDRRAAFNLLHASRKRHLQAFPGAVAAAGIGSLKEIPAGPVRMTTTPAQRNYHDQINGAKTMSDTTQADTSKCESAMTLTSLCTASEKQSVKPQLGLADLLPVIATFQEASRGLRLLQIQRSTLAAMPSASDPSAAKPDMGGPRSSITARS